jgi:hypothetical protein
MDRILALCVCGIASLLVSPAQEKPAASANASRHRAPKIWNEKELETWHNPVAGLNIRPHHYSEAEYYAAPTDNLRSYPVYHPDREPPGYQESLRKRGPQPLIELGKARTREGWIEAGQRVWEELDLPQVRTTDFRIVDYVRSREALKKYPARMTRDGELYDFRWVVDTTGELKLSVRECSGCHNLVRPDGSVIIGAQGNAPSTSVTRCPKGECAIFAPGANAMFNVFSIPKAAGEAPDSPAEGAYAAFGVPWIKDDLHARLKKMSPAEIQELADNDLPETFARFNGSPFFTTQIPSLIGVQRSRYLDHTGTHRNRGPEDIGRYAAFVTGADDGSIAEHRFFTDYQRKLRVRFSDDALYALGMYVTHGLKEPENPNKSNDLSSRGQDVFRRSGCAGCHAPPNYTNGMLIPVDGFTVPEGATHEFQIMTGMRIGTDPGLALQTRKGTGYYKVPSLVGVWHRRLLEHSGSVSSLEDWFDRKRLDAGYAPGGWNPPGVTHRAIPGHEFGLDLATEDKQALIAFLRTL